VRADRQAGAEEYVRLRREWDAQVDSLARFLLHEWKDVAPARGAAPVTMGVATPRPSAKTSTDAGSDGRPPSASPRSRRGRVGVGQRPRGRRAGAADPSCGTPARRTARTPSPGTPAGARRSQTDFGLRGGQVEGLHGRECTDGGRGAAAEAGGSGGRATNDGAFGRLERAGRLPFRCFFTRPK
jgi:hypothetical protein